MIENQDVLVVYCFLFTFLLACASTLWWLDKGFRREFGATTRFVFWTFFTLVVAIGTWANVLMSEKPRPRVTRSTPYSSPTTNKTPQSEPTSSVNLIPRTPVLTPTPTAITVPTMLSSPTYTPPIFPTPTPVIVSHQVPQINLASEENQWSDFQSYSYTSDLIQDGEKIGNLQMTYPAWMWSHESRNIFLRVGISENTPYQITVVLQPHEEDRTYQDVTVVDRNLSAQLHTVSFQANPVEPQQRTLRGLGLAEWLWSLKPNALMGSQNLLITIESAANIQGISDKQLVKQISFEIYVVNAWILASLFPISLGSLYVYKRHRQGRRRQTIYQVLRQLDSRRSSGIPPELYQRLVQVLLRSPFFDDPNELLALFVDERIGMWRKHIPRADTPVGQIRVVIKSLYNQANELNRGALGLFLEVLSENTPPKTRLRKDLEALAQELRERGY